MADIFVISSFIFLEPLFANAESGLKDCWRTFYDAKDIFTFPVYKFFHTPNPLLFAGEKW